VDTARQASEEPPTQQHELVRTFFITRLLSLKRSVSVKEGSG